MRCPKWFRNWVVGSIPLTAEQDLNDLLEVIQEHSKDIATLNTAIYRIERKQNRQIAMNGLSELPSAEGLNVPEQPPAPVAALACGDATGYDIPL